MIKSISYSQDEILAAIAKLYLPENTFELDATYSKGGFYDVMPKPKFCFDLTPQCEGVVQADCRALPIAESSIESMMLDLPFLATTGKSLQTTTGNKINRRFSVCSNERDLYDLYQSAMKEANRVLKPDGVLVMKCQDKVSSGKQYMMHCDIYNWAVELGFEVCDLFILLAKNRLVANWQRNQKHARKFHCYFWVFRKNSRKPSSK